MPDYNSIFTRLGAFARVHAQCRALADLNASVTEGGVTLRTPLALGAGLLAAFGGQPPSLDAIAALGSLRASATATSASAIAALSGWLAGELAPALGAERSARGALSALARAMADDGETVAECEVSLSGPTASSANHGNGRMTATLHTPAPGLDSTAPSQLARTQSLVLICTGDATDDPLAVGREEWLLLAASGASAPATTIPVTTGAGEDPRNLVVDGSFAAVDTGFDHWEAAGDPDFEQANSDALFGTTALRVHGAGAGSLRQRLSDRSTPLPGGRLLALGAWVNVTALSDGVLTIGVEADGTPLAPVLTIDDGTPTGEWVHLSGWLLLPRPGPDTVIELVIESDVDFAGDLLVDGVALATADGPVDGVSVAVFAGPRPFTAQPLPDRFKMATESDDAGAFSVFLREAFGVELPASATPTIDDTLA